VDSRVANWFAVAGLLLSGCGGSDRPTLVTVKGKVTLDGKPLDGATVFLKQLDLPDGKSRRPSRATTNAQGEFEPKTYADANGLPPGKYKIGVLKTEYAEKLPENFDSENPARTPVKIKWIVPKPYSDPETSGLTVEFTSSGMKPDEVKLETGGAPPMVESTAAKPRTNDP
jgi:hypothetical protein